MAAELEAKSQQASQAQDALEDVTQQLTTANLAKAELQQQSAAKAARLAHMEGAPVVPMLRVLHSRPWCNASEAQMALSHA